MASLDQIKKSIETMEKCHQIEILRLLNDFPSVKPNENNNGTFINLTELSKEILDKLEKYIKYVEDQQSRLNIIENEKNIIQESYFT